MPKLEGWLFLGAVMDMYSRKIVGWSMRDDLKADLVASMGLRGAAYDNSACESCIAMLKREWIKRHRYTGRDHARLSIFQYIETFYYNPRRRHSALEGISPTSTRGVA